jgi:hypothetical protein
LDDGFVVADLADEEETAVIEHGDAGKRRRRKSLPGSAV